jgi:hypothetical protein
MHKRDLFTAAIDSNDEPTVRWLFARQVIRHHGDDCLCAVGHVPWERLLGKRTSDAIVVYVVCELLAWAPHNRLWNWISQCLKTPETLDRLAALISPDAITAHATLDCVGLLLAHGDPTYVVYGQWLYERGYLKVFLDSPGDRAYLQRRHGATYRCEGCWFCKNTTLF